MSRRPPRIDRQSVLAREDIRAYQQEITRWQHRSHTGVQRLIDGFPELADLLYAISELIDDAYPGKSTPTDGDGRGNPDPIAHNGTTTTEGKPTQRERLRLTRYRKRVSELVTNIQNERDPEYRRPPDPNPRCWKTTPDHKRGLRLPIGSKICSICETPIATPGE